MVVVVEYPITLQVDNVGAIFLSENKSVSQRKKHIDVRHHFIHDYVEDRTVKVQFFCSEGNIPDPFTNKQSYRTFFSDFANAKR